MKKKVILGLLLLVAITGVYFFFQHYNNLRKENERLSSNQTALVTAVKRYQVDSVRQAASIVSLRLTKEELANSNSALLEQIKALDIKLKRVNSASVVATGTLAPIQTPVKDSIIIRDSIPAEVRCINYTTPYFHLEGCVLDSNRFEGFYEHIDTLVVVEHRVPKKFLFFKFGTKVVRTDYFSRNPATKLNDIQSVIVVDKTGKRKDR